jgi:hypothetical protein
MKGHRNRTLILSSTVSHAGLMPKRGKKNDAPLSRTYKFLIKYGFPIIKNLSNRFFLTR